MTVENVANKVREDGNGVKTAFTFSFKIYKTSDIKVYKVVKATGVATLQTLTTDYTVTINSITDGGTVTYVVAPTALQESFLISAFDIEQQTNIPDRGAIRESQIEKPLDLLTLLLRQLQEVVDRCVRFTLTSQQSGIEMPEPEASKIIGWNATADGMENYDNSAVAQAAAEAAQAAAEAAQGLAETAQENAETAETNAEAAQALAEAAAATVNAGVATVAIVAGELDINASLAATFECEVDDDFTLNAPTNPVFNGQRITIRFTQDGSGAHVLTLGTGFLLASELAEDGIVLSTAAGAIDELGLAYDGNYWRIAAFNTDYAEPV